jgi:hypothetical protein
MSKNVKQFNDDPYIQAKIVKLKKEAHAARKRVCMNERDKRIIIIIIIIILTNPPRQVHFVRVCGNICILISVDTLCDEFCSR